MLLVMTTLHKKDDAITIGKGLLHERLIACYNLFPIESAYWWKGKLLEEQETMVIMKTTEEQFDAIEQYLKEHSGYEVPEVIALSPDQVNASYLSWVRASLR